MRRARCDDEDERKEGKREGKRGREEGEVPSKQTLGDNKQQF